MSASVEHNGVQCSLPLSWHYAPWPGLSDIMSQPVIVDYHCQNLENTRYARSCTWKLCPSSVGHCLLCSPTTWSPRWTLTGNTTCLSCQVLQTTWSDSSTWGCPRVRCPLWHYGWQGCCSWGLAGHCVQWQYSSHCHWSLQELWTDFRDHSAPPTRAAVLPGYGLLALISMLFFLQWLWP